jgi:predicted acyl esterase
MPFAGLGDASLRPEVLVSKDVRPVSYVRWRGTAPSFDGLPLSVDVTVPCGAAIRRPTVVMAHGFTDDKTVWEETGKSDTVHSPDRPGSNEEWNNIWFASRGYAVLNYTARGWRDSCGPDTAGRVGDTLPSSCTSREYWIHLDDKRWEVRDLQWLTAALVQSAIADPKRLAVTGGSYGGAPALMAALLADRVVCGADAVPADLGPDPCADRHDGDLAPWATPDGRSRLKWAAAVPMYTFGDLIQVLAPNGRGSDGWDRAPDDSSHTDPFGVPLASTVSGLLAAARLFGSLAPPGADPSSDIVASADRLLAGNPFPADDPMVSEAVRLYEDFKSPITIRPHTRVPIFWVQGFTDALFPAMEALAVYNEIKAVDGAYPFQLFFGDLGHDYAAERTDEWAVAKRQMHAFVDHYLRPDRTPRAPRFGVTATLTRCLDHDAPARVVHAASWAAIHPRHVAFTATAPGRTSAQTPGPAGAATDPISTATLPGPGSYKGCRIMRPSATDPTTATYEFPVSTPLDLMGGPVVDLSFATSGTDVPLSVRVWDVAPHRAAQGLVTRGTYRFDGAVGSRRTARFQLDPQGYRFAAGHRLKVEVTADDSPYLQESHTPADVTVHRMSITLPLLGERSASAREGGQATVGTSRGRVWWAVGLSAAAVIAIMAGAVAVRRRRSRPSP